MKAVSFTLIFVVLATLGFAQNTKKYQSIPFKTAIVEYTLEGNTTGRQTVYYDDYGWAQCKLEQTVTKSFGQKSESNAITLNKGFDIWSWDPKTRIGTKMRNAVAESIMTDPDYNPEELAKDVMEATGIKKIGTEMYDGKMCDVYEGMGTKTWIWKNIMLKSESKILGIKIIQKATNIKTDVTLPANRFKIPSDITFQEVEGDPLKVMNQAMEEERKANGDASDAEESEESKDSGANELPFKSMDDLKGFLKKLPKQ